MKISEDIKSISYVKQHTNKVLDQIRSTGRPVVITQNGEPAAILEDVASFENRQETKSLMELIKVGIEEIKENKIHSHDDVLISARTLLK